MWQLIKAEFNYYKTILSIIFLFFSFFVFFISAVKWKTANANFASISSLLIGMVVVMQAFRNIKSNKEKNVRLLMQLPIPPWKVSFSQLFFVNAYYAISFIIFTFFLALFNHISFDQHFMFYFFTVSGLIFIFNAASFFHLNLAAIINFKNFKMAYSIFYVLFYGSLYLIFITGYSINEHFDLPWFMQISDIIHSFGDSLQGSLIILITGVLFSFATIFLFLKRKMYLE